MEISQYFLGLFANPIKLKGLGMTRFVGFLLGAVFLKLSPTVRLSLRKTFIELKIRISIIFSNLERKIKCELLKFII